MISVNTNISSIVAQRHLTMANSGVKTSIERLSTGFKINHASDDAANLSISKKISCKLSGSNVAIDNVQHSISLIGTAESALDEMQTMAQRIRELCLESMNDTYSDIERGMLQTEVENLVQEMYRQKNSAKFNDIKIFGDDEHAVKKLVRDTVEETPLLLFSTNSLTNSLTQSNGTDKENKIGSIEPLGPAGEMGPAGKTGPTGDIGFHKVTAITEEEAIAQGYSVIKNADDFANILSNTSGKYCLMCDIDFSEVESWARYNFEGELNGNGYAVKNVQNIEGKDYFGMFHDISGTIKNLSLENVSINSIGTCGALSYMVSGTVENCYVSGNINSSADKNGGLTCFLTGGTIKNCTSDANVSGKNYTGSLVASAYDNSKIENCIANGNVTGQECTGGLVGWINNNTTVSNSSATGNVTGSSQVGGLSGYINEGSISDSTASGNVISTGDNSGGLIGATINSNIINSSASGNVDGGSWSGGLIGYSLNTDITDSSAAGKASSSVICAGGLVAYADNTQISNSKATGDVQSESSTVGGLTGLITNNSSISNSIATGNVAGQNYVGGLSGDVTSNSSIINSSATGNVTNNGNYGGGLVGMVESSTIENSSATGNITGVGITGGLIGCTLDSNVKNSTSNGTTTGTDMRTGGLVGWNYTSDISNSSACGKVNGTLAVGGLVGHSVGNNNIIENCDASGEVIGTEHDVGGLIGYNEGTDVIKSRATGNTSGQMNIGGLVGENKNSNISNSYAKGNITASGDSAGGLVGYNYYGSIINECFATGDVNSSVDSTAWAGGLVGYNSATISNSYSLGDVSTKGNIAGGAVGTNYLGNIISSYSTGNVSAKDYAGGFVGFDNIGYISDCYSSGKVTTEGANTGAFISYNRYSDVENCYSNSEQAPNVRTEEEGVEGHNSKWFKDSNNLQFLGDLYTYGYNPPELKNTPRPHDPIQFQIGADGTKNDRVKVDTVFALEYNADVSTREQASETLDKTDELINKLSSVRSQFGTTQNIMESVVGSLETKVENLSSSHSTIVDTDFASETAMLTRQKILQSATSSILAQANIIPEIALQLLK